jgi:hypothetical protein
MTAHLARLGRTGILAALLLCIAPPLRAQQAKAALPFAPGERLEFIGRAHRGVSARGTMRVDGPTELRGTMTWTLHSDMEGKIGFLRGSDRSASWLDPVGMTALRYTSRERHPLAKHDDGVDIFASEGRWSAENGLTGTTASDAPLDELSFLYYLRTLPLDAGWSASETRHFDPARNPTLVRVLGREEIEVGAGRFRAILVEMRVRDARRYKGEGIIRVHLSDDACRLILRLESDVPDAGKASLALASYSGTRCDVTSQLR